MIKQRKLIIDEIVRRIVAAVHPEKIILFGSSAREETDLNSDIDILVIKSCEKRRQIAGLIYQNFIGIGHAVDIVVATPEDVKSYGSNPAFVLEPALREGIVLYAA